MPFRPAPLPDGPQTGNGSRWQVSRAAEPSQNTRIFLIRVAGGEPVQLTKTLSHTPVWSPDGRKILYTRQSRGASVQVAAVTPEKGEIALPEVWLSMLGDRFRFLPDGKLIVMQGEFR